MYVRPFPPTGGRWQVSDEGGAVSLARSQEISDGIIPYLNRLSDLLFVMARYANQAAGRPESKWKP